MAGDKFLTFSKKLVEINGVMTRVITATPVDEDEYYEWEEAEEDVFDFEGDEDDF